MDGEGRFPLREEKFGAGDFNACDIFHGGFAVRFRDGNTRHSVMVGNGEALNVLPLRLVQHLLHGQNGVGMQGVYVIIDCHDSLR